MSDHTSKETTEAAARDTTKAKPNRRLTVAAIALSAVAATTGAIVLRTGSANAATQPLNGTENPFESDIPSAISGSSGGSSIAPGEPSLGDLGGLGDLGDGDSGSLGGLGDIIPSFPGIPGGGFPSSPGGSGGSGGGFEDIFMGGLGGIFGQAGGPAPKIFKDILNGNMGGILDSILGILIGQNEIFEEISEVVFSDGWEGADGDGDPSTPPDPYKVRLPQEEDDEIGILTRSPIVVRRDKANQYDQELGRAMAAPMLAEQGDKWLEAQITTSSDMMQAGLESTQSAVAKSAEATEATSTQDIVRKSAEISGVTATMQMQEMQQNAMIEESLWNMQRLESAQLQLAADTSEAADEQNRRARADRAAGLTSAAAQPLIIPIRPDGASNDEGSAPAAPSLFATPK